jgi:predicted 3-demethylubiquinone-9 3-methyltransferase (glyoxalase superfamily)
MSSGRCERLTRMPRIVPNLWFDTQALEAAELYVSIFPNSRITATSYYPAGAPGPEGAVLTVDFELDGQPHTAINGGPQFQFDEAVSLLVECKDQDEIDHYWDALLAGGGEESMCGWLKDRFGLSWQVSHTGWESVLDGSQPERAARGMQAMMQMRKIDIAALEAAMDAT